MASTAPKAGLRLADGSAMGDTITFPLWRASRLSHTFCLWMLIVILPDTSDEDT